jgi:V8-like Glu-specific endopeptidase
MNTLSNAITTGAAATLIVFMAPAPVVAANGNVSTKTIVNPHVKGNGEFASQPDKIYTREEILNAKPLEWKPADFTDPRYQSGSTFREDAPPTTEAAQSKRPGLPHVSADRDAQKDFADQWQMLREMDKLNKEELPDGETNQGPTSSKSNFLGGESSAMGNATGNAAADTNFGTADIYTGYRGNYWLTQQKSFPWKVVGKLLIDGGGYCTAQSITGAPKNIIVTAAHCVYDPGVGFKSGWTFVPAERNGVAPYGQYRWASARALSAWASGGGRRNDVAIIRLQNNPTTGQPVSYYTGWLGWHINYPYVRNLHSIGYASNISTQWTSMCSAESYFASCEGTDVIVKGCNMTYGSSGGAWIQQYKPYEVSGYVEGVVSGPSCSGAFGQTFVGPHFSTANLGALCSAEGGCTTP